LKSKMFQRGDLSAAMLVAMALIIASAPADAAEQATAVTHGGGVIFQPSVSFERALLRVNGNGHTVTREFSRWETPRLGLFDANGYPLPDGAYRWELQLVPSEAESKRLRVSAAKNGGRAPDAWRALSGSFAIRGGSIASPDLVEPEATRSGTGSTLGADLVAMPSRARAEAADSDSAVASGAVERRGATVGDVHTTRAADAALAASGGVALEDADGASTLERVAQAPETATNRKRTTSADGTNGRPQQSNR